MDAVGRCARSSLSTRSSANTLRALSTLTILMSAKLALWEGQSVSAAWRRRAAGQIDDSRIFAGLTRKPGRKGEVVCRRMCSDLRHFGCRAHSNSPDRYPWISIAPASAGILRAPKTYAAADDRRPQAQRRLSNEHGNPGYLGLGERITHRRRSCRGGEQNGGDRARGSQRHNAFC